MALVIQQPGRVDFKITKRDGLSKLLDFDINLTGYTFSAAVVSESTEAETTITVTNTDLTNGQITISLTNALIAAVGEGNHTWYLVWTVSSIPRQVLAGDFIITS